MLVNQTAVIHHVILGQRRRMSRNDHPFSIPRSDTHLPAPGDKIFDTGIFSGQTCCRKLFQVSGMYHYTFPLRRGKSAKIGHCFHPDCPPPQICHGNTLFCDQLLQRPIMIEHPDLLCLSVMLLYQVLCLLIEMLQIFAAAFHRSQAAASPALPKAAPDNIKTLPHDCRAAAEYFENLLHPA